MGEWKKGGKRSSGKKTRNCNEFDDSTLYKPQLLGVHTKDRFCFTPPLAVVCLPFLPMSEQSMCLLGIYGAQSSFSALWTAVSQCTTVPDPARNSCHESCTSPTCTAIPLSLQRQADKSVRDIPPASQSCSQNYSSSLTPVASSIVSWQWSLWNLDAALSKWTRFLSPFLGPEVDKGCPFHCLLWRLWLPSPASSWGTWSTLTG